MSVRELSQVKITEDDTEWQNDDATSYLSGSIEGHSESEEVNMDQYILPKLVSSAFAAVLEETAIKLQILVNTSGLPKTKIEETKDSNLQLAGEIFDPVTIMPLKEALEYRKITKFQDDLLYIINLLNKTAKSLTNRNSYDCLVEEINLFHEKLAEKERFLSESNQYREEIARLTKILKTEENEALKKLKDYRDKVLVLKEEVNQKIILNQTKDRYLTKWENTRQELNKKILKDQEEVYINKMDRSNVKQEREKRINDEIETYIAEQQKEYEDETQAWMEKYDREMEQLDLDTQRIKEEIEDQLKKNAVIKEEYERRVKFVEEWFEHREKLRLERERFERITDASFKIQCWWRSVMVRKKLGPYGKKGKGKGKK